jgi:hypothetical protein
MLTDAVYFSLYMSLPLNQPFKTIIMKKILLLAIAIIFTAGLAEMNAQNKREKKKIEQDIQVEENNGELEITITEKEGDNVTTKVLKGKEAEEYMEEKHHGNYFSSGDHDEMENVIIMKMEGSGGHGYTWVSDGGMTIDIETQLEELDEELELLRKELEDLNKDEIAERLDELIELEEVLGESRVIMLENMHQMDYDFDFDYEFEEGAEVDVRVEEKDGVIIVTKRSGDKEIIREILIDEDNISNNVFVIKTTGDKDKSNGAMSMGSGSTLDARVYPNPNNGQFNVEVDLKTDESASVRVLDASGKEVYQRSVKGINTHNLKVDLKKPAAGVYVVVVEQGGSTIKLKTIIE